MAKKKIEEAEPKMEIIDEVVPTLETKVDIQTKETIDFSAKIIEMEKKLQEIQKEKEDAVAAKETDIKTKDEEIIKLKAEIHDLPDQIKRQIRIDALKGQKTGPQIKIDSPLSKEENGLLEAVRKLANK